MKDIKIVVGSNWGDEGKGLMTDYFSQKHNNIVPQAIQKKMQAHYNKKLFIYRDDEPNDVDSVLKSAEECVRKFGCKLIVLDNLMMIDLNCSESDKNTAQTNLINALIKFAAKFNVAVVLIAHPRKTQDTNSDIEMYDISGTSNIINLAMRSIGLRRVSKKEKNDPKSKWHKAICFTEHGNIYNNIEKKMYANSKGLKYLHGVEVYLTAALEPKQRDNYHTILIAKNFEGVKEINTLVDLSTQPDHMYYKPRITFDEFFNISDNVIKISACLASPLNKYPNFIGKLVDEKIAELEKNKETEANKLYAELNSEAAKEAWIEDYAAIYNTSYEIYVEQCIEKSNNAFDLQIEEAKSELENAKIVYDKLMKTYDYYEIQPHVKSMDQIRYNKMLYEASKKYNKPLIAGTDTHSIDSYKAECRSILQKAKHIEFSNEDEFDLTYKSYDELVNMFKQQGSLPMDVVLEAIENTNRMADSVTDWRC